MRVIAIKKGFYQGSRKRPGDVDMAESAMKKGALPNWVEEAKDEAGAKRQIAKAQRDDANKHADAAVAASGGAAARRKVERAGETDDLV